MLSLKKGKNKISLEKETLDQINSLELKKNIPVLIIDADEVIFLFLKGLESYLKNKGFFLDLNEPKITGNIKYIKTNEPVENLTMNKIMPDFFSNETENLELVEDAKHVLLRLSKFFQIVILTNLPHKDKNKKN